MNMFLFYAPISLLGLTGPPGSPGPIGFTGEQGLQGVPGNPGSQGKMGIPGKKGKIGPPGEHGNPGIPGNTGLKGITGEIGLPGIQGSVGNRGIIGEPGIQGLEAEKSIETNCTYICGNEKFWLECKKFETIKIKSGFWGRENKETCPNAPKGLVINKTSNMDTDFVYNKISDQCDNKNACELIASNLFFNDNDNSDVYKYIKVCHDCLIDETPFIQNSNQQT